MSTISGRALRHSTTERPVALVTTTWSGAVVRRTAALTRLVLGSIFLWAFLDKLLALGHDTGKNPVTGVTTTYGDAAWVHGASPTTDSSSTRAGRSRRPTTPSPATPSSTGSSCWACSASASGSSSASPCARSPRPGSLLLVMMWASTLPPANNPVLDDHLVDALVSPPRGARRGADLGPGWVVVRAGTGVRRHPVLR